MSRHVFQINRKDAGKSILSYLAGRISKMGPDRLQVALHRKLISLNGLETQENLVLHEGDELVIDIAHFVQPRVFPENIPLHIVYEDEDIILIHKAHGMPCHAGLGVYSGTLLNALAYYYREKGENNLSNGLIHRLDRGTSGLILCAKNKLSFQILSNQVKSGNLKRAYLAVTSQVLPKPEGVIDYPIGRDPQNSERIWIREDGKMALTHYRLVSESSGKYVYACQTEFGRTHQVRIHLAASNAPIIGDQRYHGIHADKLYLCSSGIAFQHPVTRVNWEFLVEDPGF